MSRMLGADERDDRVVEPEWMDDLYRRFAPRILALARRYIDRRSQGKYDPEDILQSVCRHFVGGIQAGQLTVRGEGPLWSLLARMTVRKCINQRAYFRTECRNVLREVSLDGATAEDPLAVAATDPTPSTNLGQHEDVWQITRMLAERDREIVERYLAGYTVAEISHHTGRAERTIRRVLARLRQRVSPAAN